MALPETSPLVDLVRRVAGTSGGFPPDAYVFVQTGLNRTIERLHGSRSGPGVNRHITGQQLCEGLRDLAIERWGPLARLALEHWGITQTIDFGKLVYALIESRVLQKQPDDRLEDFQDVYDFSVFDQPYRVRLNGLQAATTGATES